MSTTKQLLIGLVTLGLLFQKLATAADFSAQFRGELTMSACRIDGAVTVPLGKHSVKSFPQVGSTSGATRFALRLTSCPPNKKIYVRFGASEPWEIGKNGFKTLFEDDGETYLLLNNWGQAGVASGIVVGISDESRKVQSFAENTSDFMTDENGNVTLHYVAFYKRYADVKSGIANAAGSFTVLYDHLDN